MKLKKTVRLHLHSILCVLLAAVLVASSISAGGLAVLAAPLTRDIGVDQGGVTATLQENGTLSITGVGEIRDFTEETAPFEDWEIKRVEFGAGITAIGDYTFYNCAGLDGDLTIPKGVVRIGSFAFSGKTKEKAPKPVFVENLFVEALVTAVKDTSDEASSAVAEADPAPADDPAEQPAQEGGAGDVMLSEEKTTDASGPEESDPSPSSDPEETAEPGKTSEPEKTASAPESEPEQKETYTVTEIQEQEVGKEPFYPLKKEAGVFLCSEENKTFQAAMEEAGYKKADSIVAAVLNSGEGGTDSGDVTKKLPVLDGKLVLPALPSEFSAPKEGDLFTYEFDGWTELDDAADVVRKPGSLFPVGEKTDFYFIANWAKVVKLAIEVRRVKETVTYSVPEIAGYDVLSYQWQTRKGEGAWTDIEDATERQYSRKLQKGDGDRAFRCTITVKKQQNALIQLFAAAQEEKLALPAARSGLEELSETFAVHKADGVQTMEKTISLPVSEAGSTYSITAVELPDGLTFVDTDEKTLSADGKTFAMTIAPTGTNWKTTEMTAKLVSETSAQTGVAHLLQTGNDPVTNEAGTADLSVTLQYHGAYETLSGGTVGLTFEEFSGDEARNLVTVALRLDDMSDVRQAAFTAVGRSFEFPEGDGVTVRQNGGLTAGFVTEYYPAQTGAANIKLSLYQDNGTEEGTPIAFPTSTTLVLADASGDTWSYYPAGKSYSAGGSSSITLSAVGYPGPAEANVYTAERLLFVFDFSKVTAPLATGKYYLTLTHSLQAGAQEPLVRANFTVQSPGGAASLSAEKTDDSTYLLWGVQLHAAHNYLDGIWMQAKLYDSTGKAVAFPEKMELREAETFVYNADGSIQFVPKGDKVTFDFSKVTSGLADGDYQLQLEMGQRPGLQNGGEIKLSEMVAMEERLLFHYEKAQVATPEQRSLSVSANERLLDAGEQNATLELTIKYENAQEGDKLQVKVLEKTGKSPSDYQEQTGTMPITVGSLSELTTGTGEHTQTVTITVPKGKPSGTFRALVTILDADEHTVAQEPYNFIIK